jgi:hypothetical protein
MDKILPEVEQLRSIADRVMAEGSADHDVVLEQLEFDRKILERLKSGELVPDQIGNELRKFYRESKLIGEEFCEIFVESWIQMFNELGLDELIRSNRIVREQYSRMLN